MSYDFKNLNAIITRVTIYCFIFWNHPHDTRCFSEMVNWTHNFGINKVPSGLYRSLLEHFEWRILGKLIALALSTTFYILDMYSCLLMLHMHKKFQWSEVSLCYNVLIRWFVFDNNNWSDLLPRLPVEPKSKPSISSSE